MGPISIHLRGLLPIQGPQEGSEAIFWPYFGILNNFPHFSAGGIVYFSKFQGIYYLYRGLRRAPKPYFGLILEF